MHCHFLLQIVQANCSILPDGLCTHSHIPTLHTVYSHGNPELPKRVSAQMVSLWKVPGRKSEAESKDFLTRHSPAQLRSPSRFHQHHSRIPVTPPHPPPSFQGSSETWVLGAPGGLTCRVRGPLAQTQPWKGDFPLEPSADYLPIRVPSSSSCPSTETGWVLKNWCFRTVVLERILLLLLLLF